jgi:uncharacterized protein YjbJ (UPF0337 family)
MATMGILDQAKGRMKQAFGDLSGDKSAKREGKAQERKGAEQQRADDARMKAEQHEQQAQQQAGKEESAKE